MPWKECDAVSLREEFVILALAPEANVARLCRRFGISRKTGHKWLARFIEAGPAGLVDRSRRPRASPTRTDGSVAAAVVALRTEHPAWGGRKIRARLIALGHRHVPAASTITGILHRHGLIHPDASAKARPWTRFEHPAPNDLWQMDFKGHFPLSRGGRCHPLTVLDDHSRYALCVRACGDEQASTVRAHLTDLLRRYGLPRAMLADNGPPWGSDAAHPETVLTVWLMRLGIRVTHGRPYHPQTQGKEERFHRTLEAEVLSGRSFGDLAESERAFEGWRGVYNHERPHEALGMAVPASRYAVSGRAYPEVPPPIDYGPGATVRQVQQGGVMHYGGGTWRVGKAFVSQPVAVRPTATDGVLGVYFCHQRIAQIDLRAGDSRRVVGSVSGRSAPSDRPNHPNPDP